jgi:hypothetical protein
MLGSDGSSNIIAACGVALKDEVPSSPAKSLLDEMKTPPHQGLCIQQMFASIAASTA